MNKRLPPLFIALLCWVNGFSQNEARFRDITPGMKNRHIEQEAVRLANLRGIEYNWHEEYYDAIIISHKWELDLDNNGFLKGRKIHIELLAHLPSGRCAMTDFTFRQRLLPDETFSDKLQYDRVADLVYVECE